MTLIQNLQKKLLGGSERSNNVVKNIIGSLMLKGVSIVVQLMLVPLTLSFLSEELYGIWLTVSSIVLWLNFFDVGFSFGLKNKLAEAIAHNDYERGKQLVSTTYGMLTLIFIPLGIILEFVVPAINWSRFLNVAVTYNPVLCNVMRILVIAFTLQMIFNTIGTIVAAYQKVALSSSFAVVGNIITLIAIWLLTKFSTPSLINLAYAVSGIPVVVFTLSSIILFNGRLKAVKPSITAFRRSAIKDLFSLGVKFFIIQIQMIVMQQATNILISNVSGPDFVAYYNVAYRYMSVGMMLFSLVMGPMWPAFTDAYAKGDFPWMRNIYKKLTTLYFIVFAGIWLMFIVSPLVYRLWVGDEIEIPIIMTLVLTIYLSISIWDSLQISLINGIGTIKLQTYITLIGIIFHIPLSFLLGRFIGAYGVVVSMSFITLIYACAFTTQIRKILSGKAQGIWVE